MTETDRVMTVVERLLSVAVASLLVTGGVAAAAVVPERTAASPAAVASPAAAPSASPSPAPSPSPKPLPPKKKAAPAPPPVGPERPKAGCPVPRRPGAKPLRPKTLKPPMVPDSALPRPLPPGRKAASLAVVSGKGIWVTNFKQTPVDVPGIVATAKANGLRSIWIRTGGRQGYYGNQFLPQLVPAAHAHGIAVIAWDFPFLSDPVTDADRARRAFADGIDAFAPDIETVYEGTYATPQRVALYMSLVRSYAGDRPVAATVPRPTPQRLATFPYKAFPAYADLFVPMIYWNCKEPGQLVVESMRELGRMLPVAPVGQGYNMGDEGGRRAHPTAAETRRFLDVARRGGAVGASLWTVERLGPGQLDALRRYPWPGRR